MPKQHTKKHSPDDDGGWLKVPNALIRGDWFRNASGPEIKALLYLAALPPDKDGTCFVKLAKIAERIGVNKGTACRAIHELIRQSQVQQVERGRPGWASRYRLIGGCASATTGCASANHSLRHAQPLVAPDATIGCASASPLRLTPKDSTPKDYHNNNGGSAADPASPVVVVVVFLLRELGFEGEKATALLDRLGAPRLLDLIDVVWMTRDQDAFSGKRRRTIPKLLFRHFLKDPDAVDTSGLEEWREDYFRTHEKDEQGQEGTLRLELYRPATPPKDDYALLDYQALTRSRRPPAPALPPPPSKATP